MNNWTLIVRSVRFYWRTHLGVVLGAALGALVLTGSLLVGDSVKETLRRQAVLRVGHVDAALAGNDHFFRDKLAEEVAPDAAPVLFLRGSVARADGSGRVNQAQVLGVDNRFWKLGPIPLDFYSDSTGEAAVSERLAAQLAVSNGDTLIVRVEKPGLFSRDAPLSGEENEVVALRVKVVRTQGDNQFGRFSLQASQVPPFTIFLPLKFVQEKLQMQGRVNLLLAKNGSVLKQTVGDHWQLADAALELRPVEKTGGFDLRTGRVFLEKPVIAAAPKGVDVLTYLVNELRAGDKATPYSMVTAVDAAACGFLPAELADDEIVINQWLADDLGVGNGGHITMKYFVMGERRQLEERSHEFNVLAVLPMNEPQLNSSWMPDFPGLSDKKNCREWEPGFDIDVTRFRDKDQEYWDAHRGTPKAFINIALGQKLWANRWGDLTAIRYTSTPGKPAVTEASIASEIRAKLTPEQAGLNFIPLREQAFAATQGSVDFAELFVYFSFFLIAAAAVLTGLLFVFSIEQRRAETGLLLALGWRPGQVRRLFLLEGAALALIGSLLGIVGALIYTKLVLHALSTVWRGAVGSVEFSFAPNFPTLAIGVISGVLIALFAMWLASRRQFSHTATELLSGGGYSASKKQLVGKWPRIAAVVALIGAVVLGGMASKANQSPELFFGAGSLLLMAGLFLANSWLRGAGIRDGDGLESLAQLGMRNATRRRGRSLATIAVLACGVFIVVAVDSFRQRPPTANLVRESGTGGFTLLGESTLPIYDDLNTVKGREGFLLDAKIMEGVSIVPMRVRDGDDASCLNLNQALQPRLLGVKAEELESRHAFRLELKGGTGWHGLNADLPNDTISGVTDSTTLTYALKKKVGDTIEYRDERGTPFKVRIDGVLAGSILQGNVLIAEKRFIEKFPSQGGYRFFLIDAPLEKAVSLGEHLSRALQDRGLEVTPTWRRLAEFQAVENTYLSIFQVLGGLGLLLGSAGLAIVVGRNVLERRAEFGLLEAVGFRPGQLRALVFAEHRWLIIGGLGIGTVSALLAVWPGLRERAGGFPFTEMLWLLAVLSIGCVFWAWIATRLALRGSHIAALRSE
ncbi:MAG: FtsX-like permease family protein [Chthoniobacteraceae bacterium]|nr:FtsX-like permease family protein [Chthoniobacteraceae bacterium]